MGKLRDLHKFPELVSDTHLLKIQMKTFMDTESLFLFFKIFIKNIANIQHYITFRGTP